jgi:hypothetical protein
LLLQVPRRRRKVLLLFAQLSSLLLVLRTGLQLLDLLLRLPLLTPQLLEALLRLRQTLLHVLRRSLAVLTKEISRLIHSIHGLLLRLLLLLEFPACSACRMF